LNDFVKTEELDADLHATSEEGLATILSNLAKLNKLDGLDISTILDDFGGLRQLGNLHITDDFKRSCQNLGDTGEFDMCDNG
jgi:hypothetical protein